MQKEIALEVVSSSQIYAIGHDPDTSTLAIQFKDWKRKTGGSIYHYENFSEEKFQEFKNAASIGIFFKENIKSKVDEHPYTKIE
jgi:hypothetical protein